MNFHLWNIFFLLVEFDVFSNLEFHFVLSAFVTHLTRVVVVRFSQGPYVYCCIICTLIFFGFLSSTLLVVSTTFDRFYRIIQPHKAASFNTVKRAKITIVCIYLFSIVYNLPQAFLVSGKTYECAPYDKASSVSYGMPHYWLSFVIHYALRFILLLAMNSVVIHTIRIRNLGEKSLNGLQGQGQRQGHIQGQGKKSNSSEGQTFAILLLVTFALLIFNTPAYMFFIYIHIADITTSPHVFVGYLLYRCLTFPGSLHTLYKSYEWKAYPEMHRRNTIIG